MKYLEFFEYSPEDLDKLIDKNVKLGELRKKNPGKYPEHFFSITPYRWADEGIHHY